jgi:hypothetical protein
VAAIAVLLVVSSFATWATARAQLAQPPAEAINCVRPFANTMFDEIAIPAGFSVTLDAQAKVVRVVVPELPAEITCYAISRYPSTDSPSAFAWDEQHVMSPGEWVDHNIVSAGHYCYSLILGNPLGWNKEERCIDVPTSVAPAPTPTPVYTFTPPPNPGNGAMPTAAPTQRAAASETVTAQPTATPGAPDTGGGGRALSGPLGAWWLVLTALVTGSAATASVLLVRRR